jgi:hypothetical protein
MRASIQIEHRIGKPQLIYCAALALFLGEPTTKKNIWNTLKRRLHSQGTDFFEEDVGVEMIMERHEKLATEIVEKHWPELFYEKSNSLDPLDKVPAGAPISKPNT